MQGDQRKSTLSSRPGNSSANVTSAVGMEETSGRLRARRTSLFTQTVMWITGLICIAFLFGSLAQAWSNNQLAQQVQNENSKLQQIQAQHNQLTQAAGYYNNPAVIEKEARQQLGYVRPGEHPVVVVGPNQTNQQNAQTAPPPAQPSGFWQQWWNIFFGK